MKYIHTPVMLKEVIAYLNCKKGGMYIDCTVGEGGYTEAILKNGKTKIIGIDQDEKIIEIAQQRLKNYGERLILIHDNFKNLRGITERLKICKVKGILFDLGVSLFHFEDPARGFSFRYDGPLDMRIDRRNKITAFDLVNNLSREALRKIIFEFGEERRAERIAKIIVKARKTGSISRTSQLAKIIEKALLFKQRRRIHPATRTFQALRIAVNDELAVFQESLPIAIDLLEKGGRICVIAFHSLEDRITKYIFREKHNSSPPIVKILTKKPIIPSREEILFNPRARSAKLRVAEKVS